MPEIPSLSFEAAATDQLLKISETTYPYEGCGLLLGPFGSDKRVTRVIELKNVLKEEGGGKYDFRFDPSEFAQAQLSAERLDLDVVGIFHTHPDHPACPSKTDSSQPMLAGWASIIVSVGEGKVADVKAWWRNRDDEPFKEMLLAR